MQCRPLEEFFGQYNSDYACGEPVDDPKSIDEYTITPLMRTSYPGIDHHAVAFACKQFYTEYTAAYPSLAKKEAFTAFRVTASGDIWITGDIVLHGREIGVWRYNYNRPENFLPMQPVFKGVISKYLRSFPYGATRVRLHVVPEMQKWDLSSAYKTLEGFKYLRELEIVEHRPRLAACKHESLNVPKERYPRLKTVRYREPGRAVRVEELKPWGYWSVKVEESPSRDHAIPRELGQKMQNDWKVAEIRKAMDINRKKGQK